MGDGDNRVHICHFGARALPTPLSCLLWTSHLLCHRCGSFTSRVYSKGKEGMRLEKVYSVPVWTLVLSRLQPETGGWSDTSGLHRVR